MSATCSACEAPIIWAATPSGAKAPIDRDPVADGDVLVLAPTGLPWPLAVTLTKSTLEAAQKLPVSLRRNHFVTCPDREEFRQPTAAEES